MDPKPLSRIEVALKDALSSCRVEELNEFFENTFLQPLSIELDGKDEIPAETIRHKRQQTQKIKNYLLTLRGK